VPGLLPGGPHTRKLRSTPHHRDWGFLVLAAAATIVDGGLAFSAGQPPPRAGPGHFTQVQLAAGAPRSTDRPEQEAPTTGAGASVDHWDEGALLGESTGRDPV